MLLTADFLGFVIAFLILGALVNILAKDWYRYLGFGLLVFFALAIFQSRYPTSISLPSLRTGNQPAPASAPAAGQATNSRIAPQNTTTTRTPAATTTGRSSLGTGGPYYGDSNYGGPIYGDGPYYDGSGSYYDDYYNNDYYGNPGTLPSDPVRALW